MKRGLANLACDAFIGGFLFKSMLCSSIFHTQITLIVLVLTNIVLVTHNLLLNCF